MKHGFDILICLLVFVRIEAFVPHYHSSSTGSKPSCPNGQICIRLCSASTPEQRYSLLDCGNEKRLEQFGPVRVIRSCPIATWTPGLAAAEWKLAPIAFDTDLAVQGQKKRGQWVGLDNVPANWEIFFENPGIRFTLAASENGQVIESFFPFGIAKVWT
jgi:hypothetical protein